jgi:hypothetical protein
MSKPEVVVALYRAKSGKLAELETLVKTHYTTLKEYGLATDRAPFIGRASDGTLVEIFEWVSAEASRKAHDHPAVAKIWEAMGVVCDFLSLDQLPEAKRPFPHFQTAF